MTYTRRIYYQVILSSISMGLLWCTELESGCKTSIAHKENLFSQIECTHLPRVNLPSDVRSLVVEGDVRTIDKEALETSLMVHLLNASNCNITFIREKAFSEMKQLKTLILTNNHIEFIEEGTFSNLGQLTELHIDGNNLKVIIPGSLKDTVHLQILNLQNNQLLEIPAELPKNLIILNIANNEIEYVDTESLKNMEKLEILNVGTNAIKNWPKGNVSLPSLRNLSVGSSITSAQISGFSYPNLKFLHLSAKSIDDANFQGIEIAEINGLEQLVLENYNIYDLQFLNHLKNLRTLHFTSIKYHGKDVISLPADLIKLDLNNSPEVANIFLNSKEIYHQLTMISLKNCNITILDNNQADRLMKTVNRLDISQNPVWCSIPEWRWIFQRVQIHSSFLIDQDNVLCNKPSEMKGKTLLRVLDNFYNSEEQRKITFMNIMEEYVAVYGKENKNTSEYLENITQQQNESKSNIIYGICIASTLMGIYMIFLFYHNKTNRTSEQNNTTIEYSRNNGWVNFRKN